MLVRFIAVAKIGEGKADLLLHHKGKLALVRFIAEAEIGRRQSRFAPLSQRKVSAGKMHYRHKDWEEAKQICTSNTITAGKQGKTSFAPPSQL